MRMQFWTLKSSKERLEETNQSSMKVLSFIVVFYHVTDLPRFNYRAFLLYVKNLGLQVKHFSASLTMVLYVITQLVSAEAFSEKVAMF